MKKFLKITYILVFLLISLTPMMLYVFEPDNGQDETNIEKTSKLETPKYRKDGKFNEAFGDECEAWLNQNIPHRGWIISNSNVLLSDVLKMPAANVVAGRDGWIFSNETLDNYMDLNAMSDEEIKVMGVTLSLVQERIEASGGEFLFVPVPNKNSIYPEYMPMRYLKADDNNLTRIYEGLDEAGVNYVNLKDSLLKAKDNSDERLYYKRDTHWTAPGALVGYRDIVKGLGKTPVDTDFSYSVECNRVSDLDKLLYPTTNRYDEEYVVDNPIDYDGFRFLKPGDVEDNKAQLDNFMSDREDHDNDFITKNDMVSDGSYLYMVRDSFARALLPYLIATYDEARFVRTSSPSFENMPKGVDVVYEICERNLERVIDTPPVMFAPEREDFKTSYSALDNNTTKGVDEGYAYKLYGELDPKFVADDMRIYLRLVDSNGKTFVFEAFPTYDEAVGYVAYLDKSVLGETSYTVSIISDNMEIPNAFRLPQDCVADEESDNKQEIKDNPYKSENKNHQIVLNGTAFGVGDNMYALKSKLGSQTEPAETIYSCLSGTDAVLYHYPSVTIETDIDGYIYYIAMETEEYGDSEEVETEGDASSDEETLVATDGGISLGENKMDIWDKLGKPTRENDKYCIYQMEHVRATYSYKSGKITSIILEEKDASLLEEETTTEEDQVAAGIEYENGHTYLYDENHVLMTGWQSIGEDYYFFDRLTGERIVDQTIDGITIGPDGELELTDYDKRKIETMIKAHKIVVANTNPEDSMETKRKKVFDWVLKFPYSRPRIIGEVYRIQGIEIIEANDIFDGGSGDCVSESAALAFLFHEVGYENVYWVHDTGHSWVRCDDRLFDPLFAEARDYNANYNAPFTDYRSTMAYSMKIY